MLHKRGYLQLETMSSPRTALLLQLHLKKVYIPPRLTIYTVALEGDTKFVQ